MRQSTLKSTPLLNFHHPAIQKIVDQHGWKEMDDHQKVKEIYTFVKDEILFGYNLDDAIPASEVIRDGFGQCNTKATLFMALLRAVDIPNRIHGFTIHKELQRGAVTGIWYRLAPKDILHSWVEVLLDGKWYHLEGLILDKHYLSALQAKFSDCKTTFCGYGVYTDNFQNPPVEWKGGHTFIQNMGIHQDFGLFDTPDEFYRKHRQQLNPFKSWMFRNLVRHLMNRNVARIRNQY